MPTLKCPDHSFPCDVEPRFDHTIFNDDFTNCDVAGEMTLLDTFEIGASADHNRHILAVKSSKGLTVVGSKVRRKAYRQRGSSIDNNAALSSMQFQKEIRGRNIFANGENKMFAFPNFDKCDALLFLPSTLVRHLNSADIVSASKLLHSHLHPSCEIMVPILSHKPVGVASYLKFNELMGELLPDTIMCVHSTKVVDSKIHALIYLKGTACKLIYDSVASRAADASADPLFAPMFGLGRDDSLKRALWRKNMSPEDRDLLYAQIETDSDLLLYIRVEMVLSIDETSKKITHIAIDEQITSMKPVECNHTDFWLEDCNIVPV